jgi:hypothetical protein
VLGSILEVLLSMIQKSQRQKEHKDAQEKADMAAADPALAFKRMFEREGPKDDPSAPGKTEP